MSADLDEEYSNGVRSGRACGERSDDQDAVENVEAFTYDAEISLAELLAVYMRCIDPEGNLAQDDILGAFGADGHMLSSEYLFGFIEGAQAAIKEAKAQPAN